MFFVYILYSAHHDKFYIGKTNDVMKRFERHQKGYVKSTKSFIPWELVYYEEFNSRAESVKRERYLKSLKSKSYIKQLVDSSR